jgi:hypothetical protein
VEQCFSLTANQTQPAYKQKKTACRTGPEMHWNLEEFKDALRCENDTDKIQMLE